MGKSSLFHIRPCCGRTENSQGSSEFSPSSRPREYTENTGHQCTREYTALEGLEARRLVTRSQPISALSHLTKIISLTFILSPTVPELLFKLLWRFAKRQHDNDETQRSPQRKITTTQFPPLNTLPGRHPNHRPCEEYVK